VELEKPEKPVEKLGGMRGSMVSLVAFCFAIFQLSVPIFVHLLAIELRALHVIFGVSTALLLFSFRKTVNAGTKLLLWDLFLIGIVLAANINIFLKAFAIYTHPGVTTPIDLVLGAAVIVIALDAARRSTGWAIPICVAFMCVYTLVGPWMPGMWRHPAFSLEFVIETLYYSPYGMYGSLTGYSATFVAVFIIFGALLMLSGGGRTFIDLALVLTGRFRGGAAKVAVIASAMFGTISGSSVANVSVTGQYTIPLMKKMGYQPNFAGAVEAISSTGGILTPPIMGVTAFIMAEFLGVPYLHVAFWAIIPCLLLYTSVFCGVHFTAIRLGLAPLPKEEIPPWRSVFTPSRLVPLFIPIVVLLWLLLRHYSLMKAGFYACMAVIVLYVFFPPFSFAGIKERITGMVGALCQGGQMLARIVPIMVSVNMLVILLGLTGVAPKLSEVVLDIGGEHLIGALAIAAMVPLVLGTALPVAPTFILCIALIAPALVRLGLEIVPVYMFLFYFAALAPVTPPTGTVLYVAANIAGGSWPRVSFHALKLGLIAFVIPFFFILEPALLARCEPIAILLYALSAFGGIYLVALGFFGYSRSRANILQRLLYGVSGVLLLYPNHILSLLGISMAILTFVGESLIIRSRLNLWERVP